MAKRFRNLHGQALYLAQILTVVCPAYVLFGYNQSGLGSLTSLSDWVKHFPEIDTVNTTGAQKSHNATIQGLAIATFTLGALPGCLSCSYTADKFGRRPVIFMGGLLALIGQVLEAPDRPSTGSIRFPTSPDDYRSNDSRSWYRHAEWHGSNLAK